MSHYPEITRSFELAGQTVSISFGHIAMQTKASVIATIGKCKVMANITHSASSGADFFPLTVFYSERAYSAGKVPGGFTRREGRPSDREVLICRLVDRSLRPMFADGFCDEVQVNLSLIQNDPDVQPDTVCMIAAASAMVLTGLPFTPVSGVRVGREEGQFVINPSEKVTLASDLDLIVAGSSESIVMVESSAHELEESIMIEALSFGHKAVTTITAFLDSLKADIKEENIDSWTAPAEDVQKTQWMEKIVSKHKDAIANAYTIADKKQRNSALNLLRKEILAGFADTISSLVSSEGADATALEKKVLNCCATVEKNHVRAQIIAKQPRIDGRSFDAVRPIDITVPFLPETHGSALFTRGETQVLAVATLADEGSAQLIDDITTQTKDRFMLHYNFPQFSVGECGPQLSPKRREIGHGRLARRAIDGVLPAEGDDFPYVLRIVAETLSSNGSSSMATVCGGSLALMDAGVPIKDAVAGIAMGLVKQGDSYTVLSDILGDEDFYGDMDFKVAGTKNGITALQMDIKVSGITGEILETALAQAKAGRLHILGEMNKALDKPRDSFAATAPCMIQFSINPSKIREVIGRGGATIREIIDTYSVTIDISDEGLVKISAAQSADANKAKAHIEKIAMDVEVNRIYEGKVVKLMDFGAFVNILPGKDAFLHISQICHERVDDINHKLSEGQILQVKVAEIDRQGRIKLTMKDIDQNPSI